MSSLFAFKGFGFLLELFLKSTLILSMALSVTYLLRNKSAKLKHFFLSISLIALIFLPFICRFIPAWNTNLFPPARQNYQTGEYFYSLENFSSTGEYQILAGEKTRPAKKTSPHIFPGTGQNISLLRLDNRILGNSLVVIWLAGIAWLLLRILSGLLGLKRLTKNGVLMEKYPWKYLLTIFYSQNALKRKVNLVKNHKVKTPMTYGILKPVVLMPPGSESWPLNQCSSILFHELFHIKRDDFLIKLLGWIACTIFWFNPLTWIVFKKLKIEQEKACDEMVLLSGIKPSAYASSLLEMKRSIDKKKCMPSLAIGITGNSQFKNRLMSILKIHLNLKEIKMKTKVLFITLIFLFVTLIGTANLYTKNKNSVTVKETSQTQKQTQKETKKEKTKKTKKEKTHSAIWIISDKKDNSKNNYEIFITSDNFNQKNLKKIIKAGKGIKLVKGGHIEIIKSKDGNKIILHRKDKKGKKKIIIQGDFLVLHTTKDGKTLSLYCGGDKKGLTKKIWTTGKKGHVLLTGDRIILKTGKKGYKILGYMSKSGKKAVGVTTGTKPVENEMVKRLETITETIKEIEHENEDLRESIEILEKSIKKVKNKKIREKISKNLKKLIKELEAKKEKDVEVTEKVQKAAKKLEKELEEISEEVSDTVVDDATIDAGDDHLTWVEAPDSKTSQGGMGFKIRYQGVFEKNQLKKLKRELSKIKKRVSPDCKIKLQTKDDLTYTIEVSYKSNKADKKMVQKEKELIENFFSNLKKLRKK